MKISKIYEAILSSMDVYEDKETKKLYSQLPGGKKQNFTVNYRAAGTDKSGVFPVVLVTEEMKVQADDPSVIKFHPMVETYLAKGQSEVQKRLLHDASASVMVRLVEIFVALAYTVVETDKHEGLTGDLFELIRGITPPKDAKAGQKMISFMTTCMKRHSGVKGRFAFARYQQAANVKMGEKTFIRTTSLIMPFLEKLISDEPAGLKAPNKASAKMVAILAERMKAYFDVCSTWEGREAPYFMSLLECHSEVIKRINHLAGLLGLSQGVNFNADWWKPELEKELSELTKTQLNVQFAGNQGELRESAEPVVNEAPTQTAPAVNSMAQTTAAKPAVTATTAAQPATQSQSKAEEPKAYAPIKLENHKMAIQSRQEVLAATAPVVEYQSGFAKSSAATDTAQSVTAAAPASAPATAAPASTSAPVLKEAPTQTASASAPVLKEPMVHVHDANNGPLYNRDGSPYKLRQADIPRDPFLQEKNANGALIYNTDGTPSLYKATLAGGHNPNPYHNAAAPVNPYNTGYTATPTMAQPNVNPYHAADTSRMQNFGHTASAYGYPSNGYTTPQQPQPGTMPVIMLMARNGQQVQAQFDANGNAMGEFFTSAGQPVTHFSQIAHLVGGAAPSYNAPAQNYSAAPGGFQFGTQQTTSYSHF